MTTAFVVTPRSPITAPYQWIHETLDSAKRTAERIAKEHRVSVLISESVGEYKASIEWVDSRHGCT